jgi:hypothetical protein
MLQPTTVFTNQKPIQAYQYLPNVLIVPKDQLPDSDSVILTDLAGYRYKRVISLNNPNHYLFRMI